MPERVPNYQIYSILETMFDQQEKILSGQNDTAIAIARIEERMVAYKETLDKHDACIENLKASDRWWGGIASVLAVLAGIIGTNN